MRKWTTQSSDIGPGWHELVQPLIDEVYKQGGTIHQIKEKFGDLRFYYTVPDAEEGTPEFADRQRLRQMVIDAQNKSCVTCEQCGMPGFPGGVTWLKTLCTLHHAGRDKH